MACALACAEPYDWEQVRERGGGVQKARATPGPVSGSVTYAEALHKTRGTPGPTLSIDEYIEARLQMRAAEGPMLNTGTEVDTCKPEVDRWMKRVYRERLHNPGSYDHMFTNVKVAHDSMFLRYGATYEVYVAYRAENAFGALRRTSAQFILEDDCQQIGETDGYRLKEIDQIQFDARHSIRQT